MQQAPIAWVENRRGSGGLKAASLRINLTARMLVRGKGHGRCSSSGNIAQWQEGNGEMRFPGLSPNSFIGRRYNSWQLIGYGGRVAGPYRRRLLCFSLSKETLNFLITWCTANACISHVSRFQFNVVFVAVTIGFGLMLHRFCLDLPSSHYYFFSFSFHLPCLPTCLLVLMPLCPDRPMFEPG